MPTPGAAGDYAEVKDSQANVVQYTSSLGEEVAQSGFVLGLPQAFTASGTVPTSASNVQVGAISGAITLTLPAASAVTAGHMLIVSDSNGSISSSATVALKTPASGGKIGGVSANTASTSAAAYAFMNAAWSAVRLMSDGTNWNPF